MLDLVALITRPCSPAPSGGGECPGSRPHRRGPWRSREHSRSPPAPARSRRRAKGHGHRGGHLRPVLLRNHHVVGFARGGVAGDLGVDLRRGASSRASAIPGSRPPPPRPARNPSRPRSNGRDARVRLVVVALRKRAQRAESSEDQRGDAGIRAHDDHHVCLRRPDRALRACPIAWALDEHGGGNRVVRTRWRRGRVAMRPPREFIVIAGMNPGATRLGFNSR